jgi:hypothetical protein
MRGSRTCEVLGWRLAWLARLVGSGERDEGVARLSGGAWQELVFSAARATPPYVDVQGPGRGRLFGTYGSSGMPAEIDTAIDDGAGIVTLIESKAANDYALRREEVLLFSGKVRDHENFQRFRWPGVYSLVASAGRLDGVFCRWSFYEGIDVTDPDRFPLIVFARLPYFLSRAEFAVLQEHHQYDWLRDILQMSRDEVIRGPLLLRRTDRRQILRESVLHDLNEIQVRLSECVWKALAGIDSDQTCAEREAGLLAHALQDFEELGISVPFRIIRTALEGTGRPLPSSGSSVR